MNRFLGGQKELAALGQLFVCSPLKRSICGPFRVGDDSGAT